MSQTYAVEGFESRRKKVVGKPYEGEPHVRFEVAGNGNPDMVMVLRHSQGKRRENRSAMPKSQAPFLDPTLVTILEIKAAQFI